ncbi:MAG: DUF1800 family protein [Planctomycetaceae bacterium]
MSDVNSIDPQWAWSPYEPDLDAPWTRRAAAHLFRRAGFAASSGDLDAAVGRPPSEVVRDLVNVRRETPAYQQEIDELARSMLAGGDPAKLSAWWIYRLLTSVDPLREKVTLFWHGHFAASAEKVADAELMYRQNQLLRNGALGDFGALVHHISRDPAMLIYLDSATNRKSHPNENYARELMELFCLGEGRYSEQDIRELARCFTGWEIRNGVFRFNRYQHDPGTKSILGAAGEFGGDEGVDVVLSQPAGPEFIVGKLVRFFVLDEPALPYALVEPLARQFRENELQIGPLIEIILSSKLFFSPPMRGAKVRSPVECGVGLLRALEGTTSAFELAAGTAEAGQHLFFPPNVKGWDGGRTWINSSTLLARANLVRALLDRPETRFAGGGLADLLDKHDVNSPTQIVDWLAEVLLAVDLSSDIRGELVRSIVTGNREREQNLRNLVHLVCTLPEFQLA